MNDDDLAATCIADEAANQPYEGKVAVGVVILNRMAKKYESDGTVAGTVLKHFQFSGFWFAMKAGHYVQTEFDAAGAAHEADVLHAEFSSQSIWTDCQRAWRDANIWNRNWIAAHDGSPAAPLPLSFVPGPQFRKLTRDTVLYLNPKVSQAAWATLDKLDAVIFQHDFYHA